MIRPVFIDKDIEAGFMARLEQYCEIEVCAYEQQRDHDQACDRELDQIFDFELADERQMFGGAP